MNLKNFCVLSFCVFASVAYADDASDPLFQGYGQNQATVQTSVPSAAIEKEVGKAVAMPVQTKATAETTPVLPQAKMIPSDAYLAATQHAIAEKDDRKTEKGESEQKPLHHAQVDSALILDRYENKQFIKEKIEHIARTVVTTPPKEKSIAEQMGKSGQRRISVSVDENVSVKDAIMEVSHLANVDIEVDPEIDGSVILSLRNAKVADVLERIADLAQLNISVKNDVIRFEANKPFTKNYSITFVDSMSAGVATSSTSRGVGSGALGNNSNSVNANNALNGINSWNAGNNANNKTLNTQNALNQSTPWNAQNSMWGQFEEGLKYIVSQAKGVNYSINKQAGVVTLYAPLAIQKEVEAYVEKIKKLAMAQILVEVRLVEVSLEDEFSAGIDFSYATSAFGSSGTFTPTRIASAAAEPFVMAVRPDKTKGITAAVQFLQTFGTTKTISSPRLNVMNNQKSRLSFAQDYVYFSIQPQLQNQYTAPGVTPVNPNTPIVVQSTMQTVPIGVILDLQATADIETNEIIMNVRPTISSIVDFRDDPAAAFLSGLEFSGVSLDTPVTNSIPVVEKKELDSTLRIKSGDIMVIGGFNEEKTLIVRKGIPFLKDMPLLRYIFGSDQKYVKNVETVIFIKATIMDTAGNHIQEDDVRFYNDFA